MRGAIYMSKPRKTPYKEKDIILMKTNSKKHIPSKKKRFIESIEPFLERLENGLEYLEPYVKRLFVMIKNNILYIIWFLFYYSYTVRLVDLVVHEGRNIIAFIIYGISIFIAFTFGDTIISLLEGARPLETKREKEYLLPILEEVYEDSKAEFPALPKIRLHIIDSLTVNGIAIGNHTVAVTQGAVETLDREELKGIIAHEIGHIYYGDTKATLINTVGNGIVTVFVVIIKLTIRLLEFISRLCDESTIAQMIFRLIRFIFEILGFCFLWFGLLIQSFNSRKNELRADKFAFLTGHGEQLTEALYIIQRMSLGQQMNLVSKVTASHPRTSKRIGKLEALVDGEEAEI